jgi:DNA/RNA-binding domain of Phe-tRNA-synthetase-like protein
MHFDTCNAISVAFATPVAVLDLARIAGSLQVRAAEGSERYLSFAGAVEHPEPGEVTFADAEGNAHARRWTHRQSGLSAVREGTRDVRIVAEALHPAAATDMPELLAQLQLALAELSFAFEPSLVLAAEAPAAHRLSF